MNGVTLPQSVIDRVRAKRGTEHIFADLSGPRTALVVVDLQNAFMDDAIGHAVCPAARDIVPARSTAWPLPCGTRAAGCSGSRTPMTHPANANGP